MSKPTKESVRVWINKRARDPKPIPSQKDIKREIGRALIEAEREEKIRRGMK